MNKMWEPEFTGWSEDRVSLSPCEISTHSSSRNEYGIIMQVEEGDEQNVRDAAIFWIDTMHIYFRYNWGAWYKVSNDDPENCANICKRNTAILLLCTMTSVKHHAVKVYHIDKLPEELFGQQVDLNTAKSPKDTQPEFDLMVPDTPVINLDDDGAAESALLKPVEPFASDTDEEKEVEKQIERFVEQTLPYDNEIQAAVDAEIEKYGGRVCSRFRPGNNRLYSFDFAQIGKRFFTIVYASFVGDWLADEDTFAGEPPLWFSEKDHRVSPVLQATKCCSFFSKELPQIKIESIVVLPKKCIVINDEEMQECWREKCGTTVVRTKMINETSLITLSAYLASQPVDDSEVPELDAVELVGIASRFTMNPENWNKD